MKEFLEFIVKSIVTMPDDVKVEEIVNNHEEYGTTYEYIIDCNTEDKGRVIGKSGKIIGSIRDLALVKARLENKRIRVSVN